MRGLVTYYTAFVIDLESRRVPLVGSTPYPDEAFVGQVARVLTGADDGVLSGSRILICDRDTKWSATFRRTLADARIRVVQTPFQGAQLQCVCRALCATTAQRGDRDVTAVHSLQLAAQEMGLGPSDSDCRVRVQTTGSGVGLMAGVVSVTEKAGCTRQVCPGKTNASEPLMTCRKRMDVTETRLQRLAWDELGRCLLTARVVTGMKTA